MKLVNEQYALLEIIFIKYLKNILFVQNLYYFCQLKLARLPATL